MFQTLKNAWKIPELRNKLLFTLMIIVLYRLGSSIPMPWIDPSAFSDAYNSAMSGGALAWLNTMSGGALAQATLFALSVSPYITSSIVIQLLTIAIPKFEEWAKEGEAGKKKLSAITRGLTVVLAFITAVGYTMFLEVQKIIVYGSDWADWHKWLARIVLVLVYCAGASIIMWLAEKINDHGIGNGVSMILFANIIAGLPGMIGSLWKTIFTGASTFSGFSLGGLFIGLFAIIFVLASIVFIVWFTESERRIPIQYAKRVVGRKMYGGQSSNLPMKLNMNGVMPVIFASSIVSLPATIAAFFPNSGFAKFINEFFNYNTWLYLIINLALIIVFAYFYVLISFNPVEVANNIQKNGGSIPGIRSGKPTIMYIKKILNRVTLIGAIFLCIISGLPMLINIVITTIDPHSVAFSAIAFGGNSLLIVVGVALETVRDLDAQLALRNMSGSKTKGLFG
jgi:preprotein translocase subunit SecY